MKSPVALMVLVWSWRQLVKLQILRKRKENYVGSETTPYINLI